jgi:hypothetical protein
MGRGGSFAVVQAYLERAMDTPTLSGRIINPAFIEGRGIDAFAFPLVSMRQVPWILHNPILGDGFE